MRKWWTMYGTERSRAKARTDVQMTVNFFCHLGSSVYELRAVSGGERAAGGDVLVYLEDVSWSRGLGMLTWYSEGMGMNRLRGDSVGEDMAGGSGEAARGKRNVQRAEALLSSGRPGWRPRGSVELPHI